MEHHAIAVASGSDVAVATVVGIVTTAPAAGPTHVAAVRQTLPVADDSIVVGSAAWILNANDRRESVARVRLLNHVHVAASVHHLHANRAVRSWQVAEHAAAGAP